MVAGDLRRRDRLPDVRFYICPVFQSIPPRNAAWWKAVEQTTPSFARKRGLLDLRSSA